MIFRLDVLLLKSELYRVGEDLHVHRVHDEVHPERWPLTSALLMKDVGLRTGTKVASRQGSEILVVAEERHGDLRDVVLEALLRIETVGDARELQRLDIDLRLWVNGTNHQRIDVASKPFVVRLRLHTEERILDLCGRQTLDDVHRPRVPTGSLLRLVDGDVLDNLSRQ